jgi:hypothetical protein
MTYEELLSKIAGNIEAEDLLVELNDAFFDFVRSADSEETFNMALDRFNRTADLELTPQNIKDILFQIFDQRDR